MSSDVADVEHEVLGDLALDGEMPALHVAGSFILRNVAHLGVQWIEGGRRCEVHREALRSGAEAGPGPVSIEVQTACVGTWSMNGVDNVGAVVRQQVFTAEAVELHVADAITAADDCLGVS